MVTKRVKKEYNKRSFYGKFEDKADLHQRQPLKRASNNISELNDYIKLGSPANRAAN